MKKTIVIFKALATTRARDEDGVKIHVTKWKTFKTTESNAKIYRGYTKLFEEVGIEYADPKTDKNTPKNSDAFPVSISEEMTGKQIEAELDKIGAKYKKNDKKSNLIDAYNARVAELSEEKNKDKEEKATEKFKAMIDVRTLEQLEDLVNDLDKAVDVEGINKEVCKDYIQEVYEAKLEENEANKDEDDEGNSEGSLIGSDDENLNEGSLDGADAGEKA